jgi:hypothetical protein
VLCSCLSRGTEHTNWSIHLPSHPPQGNHRGVIQLDQGLLPSHLLNSLITWYTIFSYKFWRNKSAWCFSVLHMTKFLKQHPSWSSERKKIFWLTKHIFRQSHFLYDSCPLLANSKLALRQERQYFLHLAPKRQSTQLEINFNLSLRKKIHCISHRTLQLPFMRHSINRVLS